MPAPSRSPHQHLLAIDDVSRRFGTRTVVNRVTLTVDPGEIHLVVGPNGSGKSTLARLAVGLLRPHRGQVRIGGIDPRGVEQVRAQVGYLGHESQLYDDLSPLENLRFVAKLYGQTDPDGAARAALDLVGVEADRPMAVRRLSRGFVQRVALARSLVHRPALLVWDEPLTGLDAGSVGRVIDLISAEQGRGTAVVLISHDLPELWRLSAQVHIIRDGELAHSADTSIDLGQFKSQLGAIRS